MENVTIAIDAGHGGSDYGAVYNGRREKDDNLRLALAVGRILESNGVNVVYTRTTDEYETPFKKATDANNAGADFFVSIHRNSSEEPNQYNGVETLVYSDDGVKSTMAENVNSELEKSGFQNLGIDERPNLVVLRRTRMPAILVEAGFINSDKDNAIFDENFSSIARQIADGILKTLNESQAHSSEAVTDPYDEKDNPKNLYRVQTGAYKNRDSAERMLNSLLVEGFPAFVIYEDGLYKVQVGAFQYLSSAVKMEQRLRRFRYNTYIAYS